MKHKITASALKAMPREKRRYWLDRIAKTNGAQRYKDWHAPFVSLGNYHVWKIRRLPLMLRPIYADLIEGRA